MCNNIFLSRLIGSTFTFFLFLSVVIVFGSKVESEQLGNYPSPLNEQQPTYKKLGLELGLAGGRGGGGRLGGQLLRY